MPLSKSRNARRMREARARRRYAVQPSVQPSVTPDVTPNVIPWYDPQVHKSGDRVRVSVRGRVQVMTVPELDADGHFIPS